MEYYAVIKKKRIEDFYKLIGNDFQEIILNEKK